MNYALIEMNLWNFKNLFERENSKVLHFFMPCDLNFHSLYFYSLFQIFKYHINLFKLILITKFSVDNLNK